MGPVRAKTYKSGGKDSKKPASKGSKKPATKTMPSKTKSSASSSSAAGDKKKPYARPENKQQQLKTTVKQNDLKLEARKLWEQLRRGDLEAAERRTHMDAMMKLIGGRIKEITLKHDMSRIVQT
ncbi:Pumilio y domain member 6, partial [Coemansia sp. RSA 2424]